MNDYYPGPPEPVYTLPAFANRVDPDQLTSSKAN